MSTRKSKARRAIAHNARLALIKDNPLMCRETKAANDLRIESMGKPAGSSVADQGLNSYRDSMLGIVSGNSARRMHSRYGAMLPLARIATGSHHDKRMQLAVSTVNKQLLIMAESIPLHEAIESALVAPVDSWQVAVWVYAYHANRYQWLKSDGARANTKRALLKAIADIKRLNKNDVELLTSLARAFKLAS